MAGFIVVRGVQDYEGLLKSRRIRKRWRQRGARDGMNLSFRPYKKGNKLRSLLGLSVRELR